jgi:hypothetical protein
VIESIFGCNEEVCDGASDGDLAPDFEAESTEVSCPFPRVVRQLFNAIHDQAKPRNVLKGIHRALKLEGFYLM